MWTNYSSSSLMAMSHRIALRPFWRAIQDLTLGFTGPLAADVDGVKQRRIARE